MTEVTKAVIPAAGLGTRFLPVTKSMPKEMLPIIDVPVIHYVVKEAIDSGIDDIIIITGRNKRAIEDYFDDALELEMHLARNHKQNLLEIVQEISSLVDTHYIRQKEPRGLGDAVLRAEKHIGDEPFAVLLGDDIIRNAKPCTKQLTEVYSRYRCSVIAGEEVPHDKVSSYGIIDGRMIEDTLYQVDNIIEKPDVDKAPSDLGAIGRYIFTPQIFDCLKETEKGIGNEIQLTDAIRSLKDRQNIYGYLFKGKRYDTGDRFGYVEAIVDFALEDAHLGPQLSEYLQSLVNVHT